MQTKTPQAKQKVQRQGVNVAKKDMYSDIPTAFRTIYKSGGLWGFYHGITADTLSTALSNFLYFYVYAAFHKLLVKWKSSKRLMLSFPAFENLIIGVLAGILSRAVTTPLSTITVRKQTAAKVAKKDIESVENVVNSSEEAEEEDSDYAADSSITIAKDIYHEHGLSGFWRGYKSACALVCCGSNLL